MYLKKHILIKLITMLEYYKMLRRLLMALKKYLIEKKISRS